MPHEYAVCGCFSIKSDVFSFGVIVLEIISGRKIRNFYDPRHHHLNLLGHAWRLWSEENAQELIDELFHGAVIPCEIEMYSYWSTMCATKTRTSTKHVICGLNVEW